MICWILQIVLFLSTTSNESSRPVSSPNLLFENGNLTNTSPLASYFASRFFMLCTSMITPVTPFWFKLLISSHQRKWATIVVT